MKILTLVSEYPSYQDEIPNTFVHKILKELKNSGVDVYVLLMDFRSIRRKRKFGLSCYEYDGIKVYRYAFPCGPIPYALQYLSKIKINKLYQYAQKFEGTPDVVHAHFGLMAYLARSLKSKHGVPYVVTEHSSLLMAEKSEKNPNYKFFFKGYKKADRVVAVSNSLKAAITAKDDSISPMVIPNILGSDFKLLDHIAKEEIFTIACVGRLIYSKRYDLLITAVFDLVKQGHDVRLWIIGDGSEKETLQNQAKELNVYDKIVFCGTKKPFELCELLNRAHVFALPSDGETFGVVYIEANACGLPVIATDCGGPSDIVDDSNGMIIPKNNSKALSEAILKMKAEYDSYDSKLISEEALKKYGKESIIEQYLSIYGEVINEHRKNNS